MESCSFKSEQEAVGIEKHHFFTGTITIPEGLPHLGPVLQATEKARPLEPGWGGELWLRVEGSGTAPREDVAGGRWGRQPCEYLGVNV